MGYLKGGEDGQVFESLEDEDEGNEEIDEIMHL
jgi:hypothetical protein